MQKDVIETHSGILFPFLDPQPHHINIEDIAYALSRTPRWGGHCDPAINVAQHSVMVSVMLARVGCSPEVQMQGLLHDSAEAYIPDIPTPIKRILVEFEWLNGIIEKAIFAKYEVRTPFDKLVKLMDTEAYKWEYRDLMVGSHIEEPNGNRANINVLSAEEARETFLRYFYDLEIVSHYGRGKG